MVTIGNARHLAGQALASALLESRQRTWALVNDLTPAQWVPPRQRGVNPVAWELAHLAWFAEFWILRGPHHRDRNGFAAAHHAPKFAGPDSLFDSSRLAHAARWTETLPTRERLESMLRQQLDAVIEALRVTAEDNDDALYFYRLALFHEDMHAEALCWMRAAMAYPAPDGLKPPTVPASTPLALAGGERIATSGAVGGGFAFDNELPLRILRLESFEIDSAPVTAGEFAQFADAGGYDQAQFWPGAAGAWRSQSGCAHPQHWRRNPGSEWQMRWFDQWLPLDPMASALHINAFEAEAYCLWAGRRLPTAAQWECAALTNPAFQWGHSVWEWTADAFAPYPGFTPGPYQEYSAPWFGDHRELRGGAFATHERMHHPRYRNFFQPHRSDVFCGFRTAGVRT